MLNTGMHKSISLLEFSGQYESSCVPERSMYRFSFYFFKKNPTFRIEQCFIWSAETKSSSSLTGEIDFHLILEKELEYLFVLKKFPFTSRNHMFIGPWESN